LFNRFLFLLCLLGIFFAQAAHATTATASDGGVVWCNGSLINPTATSPYGTTPYPYSPYTEPVTGVIYYMDNLPDGLTQNPGNGWDAWGLNSILKMGNKAETVVPGNSTSDDVYAIQLDYWNSVVSGESIPQVQSGSTPAGALGYSTGNSCVLFYYKTGNIGQFTITYPANPSQPNANETVLATYNPDLFKAFPMSLYPPYSGGASGIANGTPSITGGGPTGE
jgi:hypothetical protein